MADQCGLGADGTLLDASQIQWYNDPDNDTPLPVLPAQARRSTHIPCPAPKLVDPNNAVLRKRKASRSVVTSEGSEEESDCEGDQDNGRQYTAPNSNPNPTMKASIIPEIPLAPTTHVFDVTDEEDKFFDCE
ncbi:uncharacterized protein EDB93DRAFT_1246129 [Suillus bovinus]|uniref:uncharacterized protein n=1 Tax=Suillus bovinus TaxID=48563 RepID=UPI001B885414|nr:uncharacterized protein EDB93DRAFT_1246129 [Suillus bovinus]KAG2158274.1 hypothetical protein EDB93DRAFT_1246129 [Suillus bovinus]